MNSYEIKKTFIENRKWNISGSASKIENEPWTIAFIQMTVNWLLLTWFKRFIQSQIVEGVIELENGLSH